MLGAVGSLLVGLFQESMRGVCIGMGCMIFCYDMTAIEEIKVGATILFCIAVFAIFFVGLWAKYYLK